MVGNWRYRSLLRPQKPVLMLASAPDPTVPESVMGYDIVCVNSSGRTAHTLGLPVPRLTVFGGFKLSSQRNDEDLDVLRGLHTYSLLLVRHYPHYEKLTNTQARRRISNMGYTYEHFESISLAGRAQVINAVKQSREGLFGVAQYMLLGQKRIERPTNGIFAVCLALYLGAPEVVVAGMSLRRQGHSYSTAGRPRLQTDQDAQVLRALVALGLPVRTTEADLARDTGVPLITHPVGVS